MAKHHSLDMSSRTGAATDTNGRWVPIAGRTGTNYQWTFTSDVGAVAAGASITVRIEASPRRNQSDAVTIATFAARTAPIQESTTVTVSGYLGRGYLRAVANINGTVSVGTDEVAPFFNITAESGRVQRSMQTWSELSEAATEAELDLLVPHETPNGYALAMQHPRFGDDMKEAILRQTRHKFQQWALSKDDDSGKVFKTETVDRRARFIMSKYAPATYW